MKTLARDLDKIEILSRLKALGPDTRARWGRMSAHQMVCHLSDAFRMAIGRKPVSQASSLRHRTLVKWIALYAPLKWPAGLATRPEVDQELGGTRPTEFAADVAELEALVEAITAPARRVDWPVHPIFGPLSESAWLRWAYLHMDHHLRQFGV
jgi:DNA-binding transcriptional ArsR family regulator